MKCAVGNRQFELELAGSPEWQPELNDLIDRVMKSMGKHDR